MSNDEPESPSSSSWAEHLSVLEASLARAREALHDAGAAGEAEMALDDARLRACAPSRPPATSDVAQARLVLADLHRFVAELGAARDRVNRELRLHRRLAADREPGSGAVYLDSHT